ncbi:MAG: InlB B-repeat-containing protein [Coprococcus sp.]
MTVRRYLTDSWFREGTDIICKAIPAKHCDLSAWGGDAKGKTGTTVKLMVTKNMNIRAAFKFRCEGSYWKD